MLCFESRCFINIYYIIHFYTFTFSIFTRFFLVTALLSRVTCRIGAIYKCFYYLLLCMRACLVSVRLISFGIMSALLVRCNHLSYICHIYEFEFVYVTQLLERVWILIILTLISREFLTGLYDQQRLPSLVSHFLTVYPRYAPHLNLYYAELTWQH